MVLSLLDGELGSALAARTAAGLTESTGSAGAGWLADGGNVVAAVPLSGGSGLNYLYIPLVTTVVVAVLALLLRWIMGPGSRRGARVADPSQGLLIGVVATDSTEAERVRQLLVDAGLRATSRAVASRRQVLVWPDDVDRALQLIAEDRARRA